MESPQKRISSMLLNPTTETSSLELVLEKCIENEGVLNTATTILQNVDLKRELLSQLCKEAQSEFKSSLSSSKLTTSRRDRAYLLELTPRGLCEELQQNSPLCFSLLVEGFFGTCADKVVYCSEIRLD